MPCSPAVTALVPASALWPVIGAKWRRARQVGSGAMAVVVAAAAAAAAEAEGPDKPCSAPPCSPLPLPPLRAPPLPPLLFRSSSIRISLPSPLPLPPLPSSPDVESASRVVRGVCPISLLGFRVSSSRLGDLEACCTGRGLHPLAGDPPSAPAAASLRPYGLNVATDGRASGSLQSPALLSFLLRVLSLLLLLSTLLMPSATTCWSKAAVVSIGALVPPAAAPAFAPLSSVLLCRHCCNLACAAARLSSA